MNVDFGESEVLEVAQTKCLKSLLFHARYFFKKIQKRNFIIGDHHKIICDALERVLCGECTRLIINIAPRYGKTELVVKNFIAHALSLNPSAKFIHLSYSDTLALDNSEDVKDVVESHEYQQLFSNVQIKADSRSKKKWYTTEGGGVYATASAGQVTGFGAGQVDEEENELLGPDTDMDEFLDDIEQKGKFGGAIIIDDPIKPEDADSEIKRDRINNRFDSTIRNRVNSRNTPIIVIMQRVHPDDLAGYLLEKEGDAISGGKWEVISLPCIKEDGEALWPFKHTIEELNELDKINPIVFGRQYMQNPQPLEGLLFPKVKLSFYDQDEFDIRDTEYIMNFIDPANKGGDSWCGPLGFVIQDKIYIQHVVFSKKGTDHTVGQSVELNTRFKTNEIIFEGNFNWSQTGTEVRDHMNAAYSDCTVMIFKECVNKETRILAQSQFIINHCRFRRDYKEIPEYRAYMNEMFVYRSDGNNAHDDAPDGTAGLCFWLRRNIPSQFE